MKEKSIAKGYVNVYDFREETDNGLNVLKSLTSLSFAEFVEVTI